MRTMTLTVAVAAVLMLAAAPAAHAGNRSHGSNHVGNHVAHFSSHSGGFARHVHGRRGYGGGYYFGGDDWGPPDCNPVVLMLTGQCVPY